MSIEPSEPASRRRCLFLAPMKPPDHPNPSGDRLIARQFIKLLSGLGYQVEIASTLRTRCAAPDALAPIVEAAHNERQRCEQAERARPAGERAEFVFTYHNYYKAPDLIGPFLAQALKIPYIIAESSRSPDRAAGEWRDAHMHAENASDAAALILTPTARDALMLEALRPAHQRIIRLSPFIDLTEWPDPGTPSARTGQPVGLISVAMMRPGVKIRSYAMLASALGRLNNTDWTLDIVGDGEGRAEVEALFAPFGSRVHMHGAIEDKRALGALYAQADLFVWPGVGEAIGMVYLEAQAHRLPCLAYNHGGIADALKDGVSGYLIPAGDEAQFVERLGALMSSSVERERIGKRARDQVVRLHSQEAATRILADALESIGLTLPIARGV